MTWFIIDNQGQRPICEEWMQQKRHLAHQSLVWGVWHSFAQIAVQASDEQLLTYLQRLANQHGVQCRPCTTERANAKITTQDQWSIWSEPTTDPDLCFINADTVDALFEEMDGMYYGYDEEEGTVHFARFEQGQMAFLWYDALRPGPSFALTFHEDGTCTEEDARLYALKHLNLPESTTQLDRFAFLAHLLHSHGLEHFDPHLNRATAKHTVEIVPLTAQRHFPLFP